MKSILIATDFSAASRNAAIYGLELARALGSKVILFSSYIATPVPVVDATAILLSKDSNKYTQQLLQVEKNSIHVGSEVPVETICREGSAVESILETARQKKVGLIIAGMKENDAGMRKLLGSVSTDLARKTTIPLMIIPERAKFTRIASIAVANDSDLEPDADRQLLDALQEIAIIFDSKVYLVRVAGDRVRAAYETLNRPFSLIRIIRALDPSYGTIEGRSVPEALNHFIEGYHVNMLAILPHKHSLLERWFTKSTTRSVLFETPIPLLILPDLYIRKKDY